MLKQRSFILFLIVGVMLVSLANLNCSCGKGGNNVSKKPKDQTAEIVESRYSDLKPTLDGLDTDELWANIEYKTVVLESSKTFDMKSSYDDENIYFVFKWIDDDGEPMSTTGSWLKKNGKWTWDFAQDGFAILWDVAGIPDFAAQACTPLCHQESEDLDRRYMTPANPEDYAEMWIWNPGVTDQKGIMATYIIEPLPEGVTPEDAYFDNKATWKKLPGEYGFIRNLSKTEYAPEQKITGDKAPYYIMTDIPASGDAGIVKAKGGFEGALYTLEIARPRFPTNTDDLYTFDVQENGWKDVLFGTSIQFNTDRDSHKTMKVAATLRLVGKNAAE